jgi:predicted DNA repair protein MutK
MSVGLVALLDDVAVIARAAAASLDDIGAGVATAGAKAAGVVIDDAAVTPAYVTAFTPDRELPVIARIARGSLFNKLVILLPVALLLSAFLPWAVTPLLMLGGLFLCYEGAEKLLEKLGGEEHGDTLDDPVTDLAAFERERVSGAVRTDLILSAEIMAIAMAEVASAPLLERAVVLAVVGIGITVLVYGAAGALGQLLCAWARHLGAQVLGVVSKAASVARATAVPLRAAITGASSVRLRRGARDSRLLPLKSSVTACWLFRRMLSKPPA